MVVDKDDTGKVPTKLLVSVEAGGRRIEGKDANGFSSAKLPVGMGGVETAGGVISERI